MGKTILDDEKYGWKAGEGFISQCAFCRHKHANAATCRAFRSGIPKDILFNQTIHDHALGEDAGVVFDLNPDVSRIDFEAATGISLD